MLHVQLRDVPCRRPQFPCFLAGWRPPPSYCMGGSALGLRREFWCVSRGCRPRGLVHRVTCRETECGQGYLSLCKLCDWVPVPVAGFDLRLEACSMSLPCAQVCQLLTWDPPRACWAMVAAVGAGICWCRHKTVPVDMFQSRQGYGA